MNLSERAVAIGQDALDSRQRRLRAWLRVGLPIVGVVLMAAAILAIALFSDQANRAGVLELSDDLLSALESRIGQQVTGYLDPAARAVLIARDVVKDGGAADGRVLAHVFAASALRHAPQIAEFSFASPEGNFMLVRRGSDGGTDTKLIRNDPAPRMVTWVHQDAEGRQIGAETDSTDTYDPRTRPWYAGALKTDAVFWTGVYVFFTEHVPGVTASVRYVAPDGRAFVFGVDIALRALSDFLASLQIARTGRALIIDGTGQVIAMPDRGRLLRQQDDTMVASRLDELGDPVLTAAFDRFRVEGFGRRVIEVNGVRQLVMVEKLPAAGNDWSVLIVVSEDEFTGFVAANNRTALLMSLAIVALAALLAGLLVRQGLRADRAGRLVLDRTQAIDRQSAAFASIAAEACAFDPGQEAVPRGLTERLCEVSNARRASVWRLVSGRQVLRCEDSFERETGGHVGGFELPQPEIPQFFVHLLRGEEIDVEDAASDRRTAAVHRVIMQPLGSQALLAIPVLRGSNVVGSVWLEDSGDVHGLREFARAVSNMIALRMPESRDVAPARERVPASPAVAEARKTESLTTELAVRGLDPSVIAADVFSDVSVMVVRFTDAGAIAHRRARNDETLADRIAQVVQELGEQHDIPYLKLLGEEVVAAAGFGAAESSAHSRIADAALGLRDRCFALLEAEELAPTFRIGMDCGIAIGSPVGRGPRLFNLWGEAVRTADAMAGSAPSGAIQVTEASYERLSREFLFRPRGSFYLPRVGSARTFVLAGRL